MRGEQEQVVVQLGGADESDASMSYSDGGDSSDSSSDDDQSSQYHQETDSDSDVASYKPVKKRAKIIEAEMPTTLEEQERLALQLLNS
jgi:hypothetical protein